MRSTTFLALLVLLIGLVACGSFPEEFSAADFSLPDIFGGPPVSLSDYQGRPVILYWLTSW